MNETGNGQPTSEVRSDDETKGSLRLDWDAWFLRVCIAVRQCSFHLGDSATPFERCCDPDHKRLL
jgi:hypothetical protein